jgi:hypothetical protein
LGCFNGGDYFLLFLGAKEAAITCMRIECGDADAGGLNTESFARIVGKPDYL